MRAENGRGCRVLRGISGRRGEEVSEGWYVRVPGFVEIIERRRSTQLSMERDAQDEATRRAGRCNVSYQASTPTKST